MFKVCLFDLDDTLVRTEDLKDIREACKGNTNPMRISAVKAGLASHDNRHIYSPTIFKALRTAYPDLKLGIFTRSPRSYAATVLEWAYPKIKWDIVVAYEDVKFTKPHGEGIDLAMETFGVSKPKQVVLIGDGLADARAAYNSGCVFVLDRGAWPSQRRSEHWYVLERVPDAIIDSPDDLLKVLAAPQTYLPELERLLTGKDGVPGKYRFDRINHFIPWSAGGDSTPHPIYVGGRSFANYPSLQSRRQWHELTHSIEDNKDSDTFPDSWIKAIRRFIVSEFASPLAVAKLLVTVVPHRPGRKPRLETLLKVLQASIDQKPIKGCKLIVAPQLLAYKAGVRSQHNEHLGRDARFTNVRDHLVVNEPARLKGGASVLVVDDVVTTGASLIYAAMYLQAAGAQDVQCLALAKNIGDVL